MKISFFTHATEKNELKLLILLPLCSESHYFDKMGVCFFTAALYFFFVETIFFQCSVKAASTQKNFSRSVQICDCGQVSPRARNKTAKTASPWIFFSPVTVNERANLWTVTVKKQSNSLLHDCWHKKQSVCSSLSQTQLPVLSDESLSSVVPWDFNMSLILIISIELYKYNCNLQHILCWKKGWFSV